MTTSGHSSFLVRTASARRPERPEKASAGSRRILHDSSESERRRGRYPKWFVLLRGFLAGIFW